MAQLDKMLLEAYESRDAWQELARDYAGQLEILKRELAEMTFNKAAAENTIKGLERENDRLSARLLKTENSLNRLRAKEPAPTVPTGRAFHLGDLQVNLGGAVANINVDMTVEVEDRKAEERLCSECKIVHWWDLKK